MVILAIGLFFVAYLIIRYIQIGLVEIIQNNTKLQHIGMKCSFFIGLKLIKETNIV